MTTWPLITGRICCRHHHRAAALLAIFWECVNHLHNGFVAKQLFPFTTPAAPSLADEFITSS